MQTLTIVFATVGQHLTRRLRAFVPAPGKLGFQGALRDSRSAA